VVCPPEFVTVPTLASLGAGIGNSYILEVKKGWEENTALHVAVFADPGSKKTPGPIRRSPVKKDPALP
jgi:hypothetical protein